MGKKAVALFFLVFVGMVMALSIWGPEMLAQYRDKAIVGEIHGEKIEAEGEGYRYTLTSSEKLYILSEGLDSQKFPESDPDSLSGEGAEDLDYRAGAYAFVVNHRGPSEKEITGEEIYEACGRELKALKASGILPDTVREVDGSAYDAVLYSAIDVMEPRNNVAVWKLSLSTSQKNADKENRLIDAYIDADSGRIYEFYVRADLEWEAVNPDEMIDRWSRYMGLEPPSPDEVENPLMETTPYFKKYVFPGMRGDTTLVTIGFYEGINELFLRISN